MKKHINIKSAFVCVFLILTKISFASVPDDLNIFVYRYLNLLKVYSDLPSKSSASEYRSDLLKKGKPDLNSHSGFYVYDLFDDSKGLYTSQSAYLRDIENTYQNKINVQCEILGIPTCITEISGKSFAYATIKKDLKYIGDKKDYTHKKKTVYLLIAIDVTGVTIEEYKISDITFLPIKLNGNNNDKNCELNSIKNLQNNLYMYFFKKGEKAMERKKYVDAKPFFIEALMHKQDGGKAQEKIKLCESFDNYDTQFDDAFLAFSMNRFQEAKSKFENLKNNYSNKTEILNVKIKECEKQIVLENFEEKKTDGDELFKNAFYSAARQNYNEALQYKPDDSYCKEMKVKCDNADKTKVLAELRNASSLIGSKKTKRKNLVILLEKLTYFEPSGELTGTDYYNMASILDVNYFRVRHKMHYSSSQSHHLSKVYCLKAMQMGSGSAKDLWSRFNSRARNE